MRLSPVQGSYDEATKAGMDDVARWEYRIVAMPPFRPPTPTAVGSEAIHALNKEGEQGWEAVTMMELADGTITTLFKRRLPKP
jgi:hypothetical protein